MDTQVNDLMVEMRSAFQTNNWQQALEYYETMRPSLKLQRSLRVEATCLAVRALVATNRRKLGRRVMERVSDGVYTKAIHYEYLALAYLSLKQYEDAANACGKAEELRMGELQARGV